jgi:hypothetical protein
MNGQPKLAAFRIERRSIAAAVFIGTQLDYAQVKQLSSDHQKAETTAAAFINWILDSFDLTSAAIETFENGETLLRAQLNRRLEENLRSNGASLFKVGKAELLSAFGQPPVKSRKEVRQIVTTIWPILEAKRESGIGTKLDAVALGLWVQTDRLFLFQN